MLEQSDLESYLEGIQIIQPVDISDSLPRHATKHYPKRSEDDIKLIVLHCTDWDTTPKRIAEDDITSDRISKGGCPACTYHEIIMKEGRVYQTLGYIEESWHVNTWNHQSIGIALMYRCSDKQGKDVYGPTEVAIRSAVCRLGELCIKFRLGPEAVVGHRELKGTGWNEENGKKVLRKTCPGLSIDLDLIRQLVAGYIQLRMKTQGYYQGEITGDFQDSDTQAAYNDYLKSGTC
jgi:N-acetyl-anhydromuramyl-L-alanine amidase AmpD